MAGVFDSAEQALRNNELESIRAVYNQIIFGLRSEDPDLIEIFADPKQSVRAMDTLIQLSSYSGSDLAGDLASIKCDVSDQVSPVIDTLIEFTTTYKELMEVLRQPAFSFIQWVLSASSTRSLTKENLRTDRYRREIQLLRTTVGENGFIMYILLLRNYLLRSGQLMAIFTHLRKDHDQKQEEAVTASIGLKLLAPDLEN